jgi:hypothetical protein
MQWPVFRPVNDSEAHNAPQAAQAAVSESVSVVDRAVRGQQN